MLYLGRKRIASGGGTTTVTAHQFTNNVSDVKMDGVASLGVLDTIVRADHVHPSDTSKADKSSTVTNVSYDSSNKKLQETINGTTTDVVTFGDNAFNSTAIPTQASDIGAEPAFSKNTAFNENFETDTTNIKANGTVSVGSSDNIARADHVHPFSDAETFAEAERVKSNNATYGAIVHQKEMEGFAQPLAKYNEFIDINSSTLTTLAEYLTYFKQNYPKCFKVRIGNLETSNFKSVVGTPTGFGNYVNCFIHPKQQGTSTGASGFFELYAVNADGSHFATGYMGEVYQSATDTYKYFTGWHIIL